MRRGFTFGTLAEAQNKQYHQNLEASNVRNHFNSKRPRAVTINSYARVLGVDDADLRVLSGREELREPKLSAELGRLKAALLNHVGDFDVAAIDEARALVACADAAVISRVGSQYFRATHQAQTSARDAVIAAFDGVMLLRLRQRIPNEDFLWGLWLEAVTGLDLPGAEAIVATAIGLLHMRGVDTSHVEKRFYIERAAHGINLIETKELVQR